MKRESTFLFLLLAIPLSHPSEYSDVLLVSNANSTESLAIADYFARKHGVSHQLQVSLPLSDGIKFSELQEGLILPLKRYLDSSNSQINYIVLSKDIPLYTDETDVFATGYDMQAANASSVDSEVALIGSPFEQDIGQKGHVPNPYYGSSEPFSRKKFGILLVTRLDGYDFADVKSMIDRSDSIIPGELASGQHVLLGYRGVYANQLSAANTSLASAGLDVLFWQAPFANESISGVLHAKSQPRLISYYDAFGCYNLGGCNASYYGVPNLTWANGSLVSIKYSFSARTSKPPKNNSLSSLPRSFVADYIHSGATAGIGYAVEPMSSQTSNPYYLAKSYLSGRNLAEIAWSSIPSLSWSAVVYGNPKAQFLVVSKNSTSPIQNTSDLKEAASRQAKPSNPSHSPALLKTYAEKKQSIPAWQGLLLSFAVAFGLYIFSFHETRRLKD